MGRLITAEKRRRNRNFRLASPLITGVRAQGQLVDENLLAHLSPLGWEHINLTGDYVWHSNKRMAKGRFRAVIDTIVSNGADSRKFSTQARWQLLDNRTLQLWGTHTTAWKILKLNSWTMNHSFSARWELNFCWHTVLPWMQEVLAI
jgi:hypothetical protein